MKVDLRELHPFAPGGALTFAAILAAVAIGAKLAAALGIYAPAVSRWRVGVGMIPRGEVGMVFAAAGLRSGVLRPDLYAAVVVMIIVTTLIGPVWLKALYRDGRRTREAPLD